MTIPNWKLKNQTKTMKREMRENGEKRMEN